MLDTQIQINSVDTGNFYSNHETRLHLLNHKLRMERNRLNELLSKEKELLLNEYHMDENSLKSIIEENDTVEDFVYDKFDGCSVEEQDEIINSLKIKIEKYIFYSDKISKKRKLIKESKEELLLLLSNKMTANIESNGKHHIRQLNENNVSQKNELLYSKFVEIIQNLFKKYFMKRVKKLNIKKSDVKMEENNNNDKTINRIYSKRNKYKKIIALKGGS